METPPFEFMNPYACASVLFSTRNVASTRAILTWIKLKLKEDIRPGVRDDLTRTIAPHVSHHSVSVTKRIIIKHGEGELMLR